ncbi:DUF4062 domain-containing protein [Bifidobacterium sp. ESL0775]|uniref:DUF4062 domain-containing protein n=1 Tax=Bifidobacterium sp. ESL0775 TaxID=2983230 RepID=UPI0023F6F030|nr:DUF4062 domain-containing protein [Bifidobacterium sp. ESL0775]WEV68840.1 DUF4062 domain-containing protein [Bifidobacterium sp. ESL0775]
MRPTRKKYQVFVSSTFTDLEDLRKAALDALWTRDYIPAGMEHFAATDQPQLDRISTALDETDILVLIIGGRYGSINENPKSPYFKKGYVECEYLMALEKKIPVLAFICENPGQLPRDECDRDDTKLEEFKAQIRSDDRECGSWKAGDDPAVLTTDIVTAVNEERERLENQLCGWSRGDAPSTVADSLATVNSLRKKSDELEAEKKSLINQLALFKKEDKEEKETTEPVTLEQAKELSDRKLTIQGAGYRKPTTDFERFDLETTLGSVFRLMGRFLIENKTWDSLFERFNADLSWQVNWNTTTISPPSEDSIASKLRRTGLIETYESPETTNWDDNDNVLWFHLSDFGEQALTILERADPEDKQIQFAFKQREKESKPIVDPWMQSSQAVEPTTRQEPEF